jgi:hypothetical protein
MLQKAVRVQASKDSPGMPAPSADFVLLSSIPDDHLLEVAADSGLALCSGVGIAGDLISLVKAKEIAQASLAQAQALAVKRAEEEIARAAAAVRDSPTPASVAADESARLVPPPARPLEQPIEQSVPVIPKPKHACKKPVAAACTQAPRNLRKTPARQARASPAVSK